MNSTFGTLPTKWGKFRYWYMDDGECLVVTGTTTQGGQKYAIRLRLFAGEDGWTRHSYDDLRITKVGGKDHGKPARLQAREIVVDYLLEHVNSVIGGG